MSNEWRTGMQMSDDELEELYDRQQASPKEPWHWYDAVLIGACLLLWWAFIAGVWKLWPK